MSLLGDSVVVPGVRRRCLLQHTSKTNPGEINRRQFTVVVAFETYPKYLIVFTRPFRRDVPTAVMKSSGNISPL